MAATASPLRLAVFASGSGTNVQAILDAIGEGTLRARCVLCVSDVPDAPVLDRAARHDVPTCVLPPGDFDSPTAFGDALLDRLDDAGATFVALAGYLKKIPPAVVDAYRGRMLNVHPSLLPAFGGQGMYGMNVHRAVVDYGVHWTGATVHLVDEEYDHGPVVLQEPVPVHPEDTAQDVADRVLTVEHRIYPAALRHFAEGRVSVDERRVRIDDVARHDAPQHGASHHGASHHRDAD